jgi:hypothetical protein
MYKPTARMRSSYEYMDYLLVVHDFVRIPITINDPVTIASAATAQYTVFTFQPIAIGVLIMTAPPAGQ